MILASNSASSQKNPVMCFVWYTILPYTSPLVNLALYMTWCKVMPQVISTHFQYFPVSNKAHCTFVFTIILVWQMSKPNLTLFHQMKLPSLSRLNSFLATLCCCALLPTLWSIWTSLLQPMQSQRPIWWLVPVVLPMSSTLQSGAALTLLHFIYHALSLQNKNFDQSDAFYC